MSTMPIETLVLRGHKDSVESLCHSSDGQLYSSSNDGTVRLWDVRVKNTSVRMFKIPEGDFDVGSCKEQNSLLCVSRGSVLYGYDLRQTLSVIVPCPHFSYSRLDTDDEINDFCFSENSVVVPSDSGSVSIVSTSDFKERFLSVVHDNIGSVCRVLPSEIVSGGYDCQLVALRRVNDIFRFDKRFPMGSFVPENDEQPGQTVNPPFVTAIEVDENTAVAVGSGDGSVFTLEIRKGKTNGRRILWGGSFVHASAVSALSVGDDHSVWSVGNDCVLINMTESQIRVRAKLDFKPNAVDVFLFNVALAGVSPNIHLLQF